MIKRTIAVFLLLGAVAAGYTLWRGSDVNPSIDMLTHIDFERVYRFAELAEYAYKSDEDVRTKYGDDLAAIGQLPTCEGRFFVIDDQQEKTLFVAVRGTANLRNGIKDAEYKKVKDEALDIYLHQGFRDAAMELYDAFLPVLEEHTGYNVHISGHSLGGAMAVILMMRLQADGHTVDRVITFGQPMVTNKTGCEKYEDAPLIRVVDSRDLVPDVPPATIGSSVHGTYRHFGHEVIVLNGPYFTHLDERQAEDARVSAFWSNLRDQSIDDHHMANYRKRIEPKLRGQREVAYHERHKYE